MIKYYIQWDKVSLHCYYVSVLSEDCQGYGHSRPCIGEVSFSNELLIREVYLVHVCIEIHCKVNGGPLKGEGVPLPPSFLFTWFPLMWSVIFFDMVSDNLWSMYITYFRLPPFFPLSESLLCTLYFVSLTAWDWNKLVLGTDTNHAWSVLLSLWLP